MRCRQRLTVMEALGQIYSQLVDRLDAVQTVLSRRLAIPVDSYVGEHIPPLGYLAYDCVALATVGERSWLIALGEGESHRADFPYARNLFLAPVSSESLAGIKSMKDLYLFFEKADQLQSSALIALQDGLLTYDSRSQGHGFYSTGGLDDFVAREPEYLRLESPGPHRAKYPALWLPEIVEAVLINIQWMLDDGFRMAQYQDEEESDDPYLMAA